MAQPTLSMTILEHHGDSDSGLDNILAAFLERLSSKGALHNLVLVLTSDEPNAPMLNMFVPSMFWARFPVYYSNFRANTVSLYSVES